jgi:hypothetical protein
LSRGRTIRTNPVKNHDESGENGMSAGKSVTRRTNGADGGFSMLASPEEVLTSREARGFLKIGRTKLHELTRRQVIPAYRIGKGRTSSLRYLKSDLIGWLYRQRV